MNLTTMRAVVLRAAGGPEQLVCEQVAMPAPGLGEALVRVRAAALTRDELEWPVDRLPAIPSYELSGVVAALGPGGEGVAVGDEVFGMPAFDRDGVAADYAAIPIAMLAPKPRALSHSEAAAVPLAALSAWQALFDHGRLAEGERALIHGATGGGGEFATPPASPPRAHVIAPTPTSRVTRAPQLRAQLVRAPPARRPPGSAGHPPPPAPRRGGSAAAGGRAGRSPPRRAMECGHRIRRPRLRQWGRRGVGAAPRRATRGWWARLGGRSPASGAG